MLGKCNNCGKKITITGNKRRNWKHHFCNRDCYNNYRKKHPTHMKNHSKKYDWDIQRKLTELSKKRKKLT